MTDTNRPPTRKRGPSRRAATFWTLALSLAAAVAIWGALSLQLAAGNDPALGPKTGVAAASDPQARPRRIVKTTVLVRRIPVAPASSDESSEEVPSAAAPSAASPVTVAPSAPPAVAPAPAPAPAPVQTSVS